MDLEVVDLAGYAASVLVVTSLAMTSVVRLRAVGLAASASFLVYGLALGAIPIVITNVATGAVHAWFLRRELGMRRELGASPIDPGSPFLRDFIEFHLEDIRRFQPAVATPYGCGFSLLLVRDGLPAGALCGNRDGEILDVTLDYVMREYRDSRIGQWLFGTGADVFRDAGIRRLVSHPGNDAHRHYLESVGFTRHGKQWLLDLGR